MRAELTISEEPGGYFVLASSTKKIPGKFSRTWQKDLPEPPEKCVLENKEEREGAHLRYTDSDGEKWLVIDSLQAPETPHYLVVPDRCWPTEKMRSLGGEAKIRTALRLACEMVSREPDSKGLFDFSIQVGQLSAQNQRHTHYHIYRPNFIDESGQSIANPQSRMPLVHETDERFVLREDDILVYAGGEFTGQCFIVGGLPFNIVGAETLARTLNRLVQLQLEKFKSVEGLPPDYRFELEFWNQKFQYGIFTPKLNNTGTLEDHGHIDRRRCLNLAWSHEETARYLREE